MDPNSLAGQAPNDSAPESDEVMSDYAPSLGGESTFGSLTSSVNGHVWEYGRRYHVYRYGRYPIPNDEDEYRRENLRHVMFKELLDGELYLAPIGENPQKIIDLGTGFGDWVIEVGENFPSARVIGVDLSPIQPLWIPPNVEFIVDDVEDEWVHDSDFDFAHLRFICTVIKDTDALFTRIFENLKPGGWVESQELFPELGSDDGPLPPDYAPSRFYKMCGEVLHQLYGFNTGVAGQLPDDLKRLGFINVQRRVFHLPIGDWPRDPHLRLIGGTFREVILEWVTAMAARPFVEAGIDKDEIDEMVENIQNVVRDKHIHAYMPVHYTIAQKPPE
ncbi:S-adenosyl-L-methionine-dependent methyltransferase [Podospora didyma]|uniref:S-adenosyl-L-methionine-dependent methyltransferase n=1 Tax=Podospora didyma TaxID=330526 RepID=A0AAE0P018_9PEZI|nr:S-adenosyl-L-methionine-dependent methyltransferase [Podospora didyma]